MRPLLLLAALTLPALGCQALPGPERATRPWSWSTERAQAASPPRPTAARVEVLERGARLGDALARLGRRVGWNLVCEPEAAGRPVTLRVFDLPWREALELLLERAGCEVASAGERTLYVTYPPRVTITTSW